MRPTARLTTCTLAVLLGVLACAGPAPAAQADSRHIAVTVDRTALTSGQTFIVTATATVRCTWLVEWNGERRHVDARRFVTRFTAPAVARRTRIDLDAGCFYPVPRRARPGTRPNLHPGPTRTATDVQTIQVVVPPSWAHTVPITVVPAGTLVDPPHGGAHPQGLPNTGGPDLRVLLTGLLLLLSGAAAIAFSSREEPSLPASRG